MTAAMLRAVFLPAFARSSLVIVVLGAVHACAASRPEPDPVGATCDASADCVGAREPTGQCVFVRACVAGRCEAVDDAGTPASRVVSCGAGSR